MYQKQREVKNMKNIALVLVLMLGIASFSFANEAVKTAPAKEGVKVEKKVKIEKVRRVHRAQKVAPVENKTEGK